MTSRPFAQFGEVEYRDDLGKSRYNALETTLDKRFSNGYTIRAVYTLSKLEDDGVVNTSNPQNIFNFGEDFTRSLQDRRHRFAHRARNRIT